MASVDGSNGMQMLPLILGVHAAESHTADGVVPPEKNSTEQT